MDFYNQYQAEILMIGGFCTVMVVIYLSVKISALFKKKKPPPPPKSFMSIQDANEGILKHLGELNKKQVRHFGDILYDAGVFTSMGGNSKRAGIPIDPRNKDSFEILRNIEHNVNRIKTNEKFKR